MRTVTNASVLIRAAPHPRVPPGYAVAAALIAIHGSGSLVRWGAYRDPGAALPGIMGDLGLAAAAGMAGIACVARAVSIFRVYRRACYRCWSWLLAGLSCAAAGIGNGVWAWYELAWRTEPPTPSVADWCFLGFGPLALAALLAAHGDRIGVAARVRLLLDTMLVAGSLFAMAWGTALAMSVVRVASPMRTALLLGYPMFDLILVSLLMALRTRTPDENGGVGTGVRVGYLVIVICDSIFTLPAVHAGYRSGGVLDTGWFAGYLLIAAAASTGDRCPGPAGGGAGLDTPGRRPRLRIVRAILPYLAAGLCLAGVLGNGLSADHELDPVLLVSAAVVLVALIARQGMTLLENQRLTDELRAAAATLTHHAYHDTLTGLANRALLTDRLEHALTQRAAEWEPVAVLFLDLDGFKAVNDSAGHEVGDQVLIEAGRRLTGIVRAGDTVARFGGDEFVIVLELGIPPEGARRSAERLLAVLSLEYAIAGRVFRAGASIGLAFSVPGGSASELLRRADAAMYTAKSGGKGRIHVESPSEAWVGVVDAGVPDGETASVHA